MAGDQSGIHSGDRAGDRAGDGTVGKALDVLDRVAAFGRPVRFSELMAASPYPKATLFRLLQTLTSQGMLTLDPDRSSYAPGLRLVRLAHAAWHRASLAPLARPFVDALAAETGETVHLAQLDGAHVLYLDKRNAAEPVGMFSQAGKVGPAHCTGVGKAMLAILPEADLVRLIPQMSFHRHTPATLTTPEALFADLARVRRAGHAFDREEHEPGIICVAAPVLTARGRVLGGLSLTTTTARSSLAALTARAGRVTETAAAIAAEAETWHFPEGPAPGSGA